MALNYALLPNPLTADPNDYMAKVQNLQSRSLDDVIDQMVNQGSTVTRADIVSVLEDYAQALEAFLRQGLSINTPLFNLIPSIQGTFQGRDAPFDPAKHRVRVNVNPGVRLKQVEGQIALQRVSPKTPAPEVLEFEDVASGTSNAGLTPGGVGKLRGSRLKVEENDPLQGVFFIDSTGAETRTAVVIHNKPSAVYIEIPATLAPGTYTIEVRAKLHNVLRTGVLPATVAVS